MNGREAKGALVHNYIVSAAIRDKGRKRQPGRVVGKPTTKIVQIIRIRDVLGRFIGGMCDRALMPRRCRPLLVWEKGGWIDEGVGCMRLMEIRTIERIHGMFTFI